MSQPKACYNCIYGKIHRGSPATYWQPEEPDEVECLNEKVPDELFENDHDLDIYAGFASNCNCYEPIMVEKCIECGAAINQPLYSWLNWEYEFFSGEAMPMCSEKCQDDYSQKQDAIYQLEKELDEEAKKMF